MAYQISVDHSTPYTILELRRTVRTDQAGEDIGSGMDALYGLAAANGLAPAGPPTTTYIGEFRPGAKAEVDFGLPVFPNPIGGANEEMTLRQTEPQTFARLTHRGSYHLIGDAYNALYEWLRGSPYQQAGPPTEVYMVAPDEALDPRDLLTEIRLPIAAADLTVRVSVPFAQAVSLVRDALTTQGFGVLTEIDIRATLFAKLGTDMEDYVILGACNPNLAQQALDIDRQVGKLLPCNVVVRAEDDSIVVEAVDPDLLLRADNQPGLRPIAQDARSRLAAALTVVAAGAR
ncbi:DUF302 domain-containing protein [Nocardia brasiliensis]|uniref:AraC effector-binding domain-containing protein n=1 Tax=Nocardia brasiliensis (strain ATCC 700358 / HUJEG-1) TaxID=1133849 RepID=K0EWU4_NOCB7|nr:hypothetical protein O3I_018050 [Nocardia brasiliensis ATCC 700358]